jgi:hypothetical protein
MVWQEIRAHYPQQWVLVEAIKAHSETNKRILEHLTVVDTFPDSPAAMQRYAQLHREAPQCEFYVFHTSRETLDITERQWLGVTRRAMMIRLQDGLPYVAMTLLYRNQQLELPNVLINTGLAGTVFPADKALTIGLRYEADDTVHRIRGVGGAEFVFSKRVDRLSLGELHVNEFVIEVGAMDYGLDIDGIVGMDFLIQVDAIIDLAQLEVH